MCTCQCVIGWAETVLAHGALPCVLVCGLPDSQPSCRWHSVAALGSAGTFTLSVGHMKMWTHMGRHKILYVMCQSMSLLCEALLSEWLKMTLNKQTELNNYHHSDDTHWQVSPPQGCRLMLKEGRLQQEPDCELTPEVLVTVNKTSL